MFRPMAITVAIALFGSLLLALVLRPGRGAPGLPAGRARVAATPCGSRAGWTGATRRSLGCDAATGPRRRSPGAAPCSPRRCCSCPRSAPSSCPSSTRARSLIAGASATRASRSRAPSRCSASSSARSGMSPEVTTVVSRVGRAEIGSDPMGVNQADVFVMLQAARRVAARRSPRTRSSEEIERTARGARARASAFGFTQPMAMRLDELISGVRADLAVKVFGDDSEQYTREVAEQVAAVIRGVSGRDRGAGRGRPRGRATSTCGSTARRWRASASRWRRCRRRWRRPSAAGPCRSSSRAATRSTWRSSTRQASHVGRGHRRDHRPSSAGGARIAARPARRHPARVRPGAGEPRARAAARGRAGERGGRDLGGFAAGRAGRAVARAGPARRACS